MNNISLMFPEALGSLIMQMLKERNALSANLLNQHIFVIWPRENRLIVIFNPHAIVLNKVGENFAHDLSTTLQGKRVVRTNSRGIFLQVGYEAPKAPVQLTAKDLDVSVQPGPLDLPIGHTERGDLWISLLEADSVLIAGSRGGGKSMMLHAWIQSLQAGKTAIIYAWDGKENVEFLRYHGQDNFKLIPMGGLMQALMEIKDRSKERLLKVLRAGHPNVAEYNANESDPIAPIALIIDETALAQPDEKELLKVIVEKYRAGGIYPILATNRPTQEGILVKTNLTTRICFAVPSWQDSQMALGRTGAEKLPKEPGRGLLEWKGRMLEFQAFKTLYPEPDKEVVAAFLEAQAQRNDQDKQADQELRDQVIAMHEAGMSISSIVREIWNVAGGGAYYKYSDQVKAILSTSSSSKEPESSL